MARTATALDLFVVKGRFQFGKDGIWQGWIARTRSDATCLSTIVCDAARVWLGVGGRASRAKSELAWQGWNVDSSKQCWLVETWSGGAGAFRRLASCSALVIWLRLCRDKRR